MLFQDGGVRRSTARRCSSSRPPPLTSTGSAAGWGAPAARVRRHRVRRRDDEHLVSRQVNLLFNARNVLRVTMNGSAVENDRRCRVLGDRRFGPAIDSEFDDPVSEEAPRSRCSPMSATTPTSASAGWLRSACRSSSQACEQAMRWTRSRSCGRSGAGSRRTSRSLTRRGSTCACPDPPAPRLSPWPHDGTGREPRRSCHGCAGSLRAGTDGRRVHGRPAARRRDRRVAQRERDRAEHRRRPCRSRSARSSGGVDCEAASDDGPPARAGGLGPSSTPVRERRPARAAAARRAQRYRVPPSSRRSSTGATSPSTAARRRAASSRSAASRDAVSSPSTSSSRARTPTASAATGGPRTAPTCCAATSGSPTRA